MGLQPNQHQKMENKHKPAAESSCHGASSTAANVPWPPFDWCAKRVVAQGPVHIGIVTTNAWQ